MLSNLQNLYIIGGAGASVSGGLPDEYGSLAALTSLKLMATT
jgi:hypothetical protein